MAGEVRKYKIRTRALDADEALQGGAIPVQPAVAGGGAQQGVLDRKRVV